MASSKNKGRLAIGLGLLGLIFLLPRKARAMGSNDVTPRPDVRLTPHFWLSEWLRSTSFPQVANYVPTEQEIRNARTLAANVLEPLRTLTGPIRISGGARPESMVEEMNAALRRAGYRPSNSSDHRYFNGVDIQFPGKGLTVYQSAFEALQDNPKVRQVILYLKSQENAPAIPTHIHVSAVIPGQPAFTGTKFAFVDLDGQQQLASIS